MITRSLLDSVVIHNECILRMLEESLIDLELRNGLKYELEYEYKPDFQTLVKIYEIKQTNVDK